jgi:hypothetical protein
VAKKKGQEHHRRPDYMIDLHGREYFANIEIESGDPIDLVPHQWTAPTAPHWARGLFLPPIGDSAVVKIVPLMERNRRGYQIDIDYAAWEQKVGARNAQRTEQLRTMVQNMTGVNPIEVLERPPKALLDYLGPEAFPPVEIIRAMRAGNAWALGASDDIPEKALAMLERIRPQVLEQRLVRLADDEVEDPFATDPRYEKLLDLEDQHDPLESHDTPKPRGRPAKGAA